MVSNVVSKNQFASGRALRCQTQDPTVVGQKPSWGRTDGPGVYLNWIEGVWKGKEGVRRYFTHGGSASPTPVGFSHQLMPTSGLVAIAPGGMTAKGRWYGFGAIFNSVNGKVENGEFTSGIYEVGYVKENGIWKIQSFDWIIPYVVKLDGMCEGPEIRSRRIISNASEGGAFIPGPDVPLRASSYGQEDIRSRTELEAGASCLRLACALERVRMPNNAAWSAGMLGPMVAAQTTRLCIRR